MRAARGLRAEQSSAPHADFGDEEHRLAWVKRSMAKIIPLECQSGQLDDKMSLSVAVPIVYVLWDT
jgi:hypothetical protein